MTYPMPRKEYPYSRVEECSWSPDEAARHLSELFTTDNAGYAVATSEHSRNVVELARDGWSSHQANTLRHMYGANRMYGDDDDDEEKPWWIACAKPILEAMISQLQEPLILMLLSSAGISVILGNKADALSIVFALLIVATVAAVQEWRSEAALEKLAHLVPLTCRVLRDGKIQDDFEACNLVVGDLVLLATGDRIPADCRVVDSVELMLDESNLTGENQPVSKIADAVQFTDNPPPLTQQLNIVFAGTLVSSGRGRALVVAVGEATEFGKVAAELESVTSRKSPLQLKIDELAQRLAFVSSIVIALIAVIGWILGRPFLETLTIAVSLAVAAIPEGLPICVTVTLALGVLSMARRNAIVKKLPVVESLGCATVVASDKTGTLTQNEMTVRVAYSLAWPDISFGFTGRGYDATVRHLFTIQNDTYEDLSSKGSHEESATITNDSPEQVALRPLLYTACLCNNATFLQVTNVDMAEGYVGGSLSGQPTELALLVAAAKAGIADPRPHYHRIHEIPFTSERKRMEIRARPVGDGMHACSTFAHISSFNAMNGPLSPEGASTDDILYFVKGMPEMILSECLHYIGSDGTMQNLSDDDRAKAVSQTQQMASSGLRVLAFAFGKSLDELLFIGLMGMEDPPRVGVAESVRKLRAGGVKVMMVTGDSKETALAIAKRCGILGDSDNEPSETDDLILTPNSIDDGDIELETIGAESISGTELETLSDESLEQSINFVKVFYRVAPRHKLAIVRALQKQGDIVAMTGDGVNDATALKGADIGIAMGKGTDVAKEAADVVLADNDFSTITMAIAEGKGIFFNIRCFLAFQLSTSFAALTMASVATAFGLPTPLNAMQILWINIIMDGPPAQSLGVEPVDDSILQARPRKADDPIVTRALLLRAITSASLIAFLTLLVFTRELDGGEKSRRDTTMTFMMFVNCDLFNAYVCRSADRCFYELSPTGNIAFLWAVGGSIIGQLLVVYWPPLQAVFQTERLTIGDLLYIVVLSSSMLWLDTVRKLCFPVLFRDGFNPALGALSKYSRSLPLTNGIQLNTLPPLSNINHSYTPMTMPTLGPQEIV